jgi:hypothetical protein
MKAFLIALATALLIAVGSAQATAPTSATGGYGMSWSVTYSQLPSGQWEYGYDVYAQGHVEYYDYFAMKFDFGDEGATTVTDNVANMYNPGGDDPAELREFWTVNGILGNNGGHWMWGGLETGVQASYGDLSTNTWITDAATISSYTGDPERWLDDPTYHAAHAIANPFHAPSDYAVWAGNTTYYTGEGDAAYGLYAGMQGDEWTGGGSYYTPTATDLAFDMTWFLGGHLYNNSSGPQLMATIRIVSDLGPNGSVSAQFYSSATSSIGAIVGPGVGGLRGDFDGDGDIDADDIDILMANLGGNPATYDLTDDGVVDQDDVDEWVFNIVPIGENVGTVYGDFNLDGEVNAGDLALLATNYGTVGDWGWATGDGNGDGNVDAGDLAMLATNYGTVVHTVPEPVTMSLLAVGGAALLRRRSR